MAGIMIKHRIFERHGLSAQAGIPIEERQVRMRRLLCLSSFSAGVLFCLGGCGKPKLSPRDEMLRASAASTFVITPSHHLTISLDATFPEKCLNGYPLCANYEAVAHDVLEVVERRFSGAALHDIRPIVCHVSPDPVPLTNVTLDPAVIRIGIAMPPDDLNGLDYNRFAYQLGHELGHVMLGARRTNGLIETLADAISYQALNDLSDLWARKYANYALWKNYAPSFVKYRSHTEQENIARLPKTIQDAVAQEQWDQVTVYLRAHESELDQDPYCQRGLDLRALGAMALLSHPVSWQDLGGIAMRTSPTPEEDGEHRNDLPTDISGVSWNAKSALARFR